MPGCAEPRAQEMKGSLMAAAAPHREPRGRAELCSVTATGPGGTAWSCVRGGTAGGQGMVLHQRAVGTEQPAQSSGHSPECAKSIWTQLSDI